MKKDFSLDNPGFSIEICWGILEIFAGNTCLLLIVVLEPFHTSRKEIFCENS